MVITAKEAEAKKVEKLKGGVGKILQHVISGDGMTNIFLNEMTPGSTVGFHKHEGTSEVIYVVEGEGQILEDGVYKPVKPGDVNYCPEGCEHSVIAGENGMTILAVIPKQPRGE